MDISIISMFFLSGLGGMAFLAYRNSELFMPMSAGMLAAALPAWGFTAGASFALNMTMKRLPKDADKGFIDLITTWVDALENIPTLLIFTIIALGVMRVVSQHVASQKNSENNQ